MVEAGLNEVESYVSRPQNKVTQFISTRPIMDLFMATEWCPGSRVVKRWWEQGRLDLDGMRMADQEAERTEVALETDGVVTETD